jgi:phosphoglycolate phosphatase-like HAD superfamily hydrolase
VHILWDWNGTLLDDTEAALNTLNIMLARRGADAIGMEFYRENFAFPVKPFYEAIGMVLENEDWDELAREYHDLYALEPKRLNRESELALERAATAGAGQSIISALRQDLLERAVGEFGLARYFTHVYGVDNLDGASKHDRAMELAAVLKGEELVVIGDAIHDLEVARLIGAKCVLCSQGSHSHRRLAALAPTGRTLLEAVDMALDGSPCTHLHTQTKI